VNASASFKEGAKKLALKIKLGKEKVEPSERKRRRSLRRDIAKVLHDVKGDGGTPSHEGSRNYCVSVSRIGSIPSSREGMAVRGKKKEFRHQRQKEGGEIPKEKKEAVPD